MSLRVVSARKTTHSKKVSKPRRQQGKGFFTKVGRFFKKVPILSTAAEFIPGNTGKIAHKLLKSQGLGRTRKAGTRKR